MRGEPFRCPWSDAAPDYRAYHDLEWGRPRTGDAELLERLCLEGFQAGLSWLTILRKRDAFRRAFHGFELAKVARFGERDVARLLSDAAIVRSRPKIEAAIANARAALRLAGSGRPLAPLIWSFAPKPRRAPRSLSELPAATPGSTALAKELRRLGFRFVGPTTAYALFQAVGVVNDHLERCHVRREVQQEQLDARRRLTSARGAPGAP